MYANSGIGAFTATMACQDSTILTQSSSNSDSDRLLKRQNWLKGVGLVVIGSDIVVECCWCGVLLEETRWKVAEYVSK